MSCSHPKESIKWVREGPISGVCECSSCGQQFEVKGWAIRGAGKSAKEGFEDGAIRGFFDFFR
jgi:hypothetical protein